MASNREWKKRIKEDFRYIVHITKERHIRTRVTREHLVLFEKLLPVLLDADVINVKRFLNHGFDIKDLERQYAPKLPRSPCVSTNGTRTMRRKKESAMYLGGGSGGSDATRKYSPRRPPGTDGTRGEFTSHCRPRSSLTSWLFPREDDRSRFMLIKRVPGGAPELREAICRYKHM